MLKTYLKRKMLISGLIIILLLVLYFFPKDHALVNVPTNYVKVNQEALYLVDNYNYVAKINMNIKSTSLIDKIKEKLNILIVNGPFSHYLPNSFLAIIPPNTEIYDITIQDGIIKINFSKHFLNVSKNNEEKSLESIVYTLTEEPEITGVMLFVEGNILTELPHSHKKLPSLLDRSIGINKVYDLNTFKDIKATTVYFLGKTNLDYYYIPVTFINNDKHEKMEIIINELKSTPIYQTNLISFLNDETLVLNYELKENDINLSFNEYIFNDLNSKQILEEVKYSIYLSTKDNYNVEHVNYYYNDELITTLP